MKSEHIWHEEISITGSSLVNTVKQLIHAGDVRRIIIKNSDGAVLMEIPLLVGAVVTLAAPVVAAVAAIGLFASRLTVVIEKVTMPESPVEAIGQATPSPRRATREDILESILVEKVTSPEKSDPIVTKSKRNEQLETLSEEEALAALFCTERPYEQAEM